MGLLTQPKKPTNLQFVGSSLISTALVFVAAIIISCISLALFKGLKFEVEDKNCPEEVKAVETNIKALKYGTFASAILLILSLII